MISCPNMRRLGSLSLNPLESLFGSGGASAGGVATATVVDDKMASTEIGAPYGFSHELHVSYNFAKARFEGMPDNFDQVLLANASSSVSASTSSCCHTGSSLQPSTSTSTLATPLAALPPKPASRGSSCSSCSCSCSLRDVSCPSSSSSYDENANSSRPSSKPNKPNKHKRGRSTTSSASVSETDLEGFNNVAGTGGGGGGGGYNCNGLLFPVACLNQHFRVHFRHVPRLSVKGYDDRIPAVLLMLQQHFLRKQGHLAPYIFRESPCMNERDAAMAQINNGTFDGDGTDVRILGDLIKLWFRELPKPILHQIAPKDLERIVSLREPMQELVRLLGRLERAIVFWLADLLSFVALHQTTNHMGIEQLAIIMAPNLVRIETANPMVAVTFSKAAVDLLRCVLQSRLQEIQGNQSEWDRLMSFMTLEIGATGVVSREALGDTSGDHEQGQDQERQKERQVAGSVDRRDQGEDRNKHIVPERLRML